LKAGGGYFFYRVLRIILFKASIFLLLKIYRKLICYYADKYSYLRGFNMGFFRAKGIKEYEAIAAKNHGRTAILLETRNGKNSPETRLVMIVKTPRQYSIKLHELAVFFESAFDSKFPVKDEYTYCRYRPINEEFELTEDFIKLKNSGDEIQIKKVPYYAGLLDK
jgi:hypothetical protein